MMGVAWIAAFLAYAAVYQASVQVGIATWWIGPRAQPTPSLVRVLPFALSLAMVLLQIYNVRQLAFFNILGAILAAGIAIPDLSRSIGLGLVELTIAGLTLLAALAALSGRYQLRSASSTGAPAPDSSGFDPPVRTASVNGAAGNTEAGVTGTDTTSPQVTEWAPPSAATRQAPAGAGPSDTVD